MTEIPVTPIKPMICPVCGYFMDVASYPTDPTKRPKPGDLRKASHLTREIERVIFANAGPAGIGALHPALKHLGTRKQVDNALHYLNRQGNIKKVDRGRFTRP